MSDGRGAKGSDEPSGVLETLIGMESSAAVRSRDRALVERYLRRREEEAFRALYRAHSPYLFGLAMRVCGGRRDMAEEAVQEAWIRAAHKLPEFRWQSALKTWLGGFVVNCAREQLRRRRPGFGPTEREPSPPEAPSPDGRLDLDRMLAALPDHQRIVVVLYAIEGYTHPEIAQLLEIATGTSKSRLFEARQSLRRLRAAPKHTPGAPS